jgi:hypothetical protein
VHVRIGVTYTSKEIEVELPEDSDRASIRARVEDALTRGTGVLWLSDRRGREVALPADKIAYVELGSPTDDHRIGFGA